jgi:hypothetical protein
MTYYANLGTVLDVGSAPSGNRLIIEVDGGEFKGEKLNGKLRDASCADWMTVSEKYGHIDVRATFETDDGAITYVQYFGVLEFTPGIQAALAGESFDLPDDVNFSIVPAGSSAATNSMGVDITSSLWTDQDIDRLPDNENDFYYVTIPEDTKPEFVLETLSSLRE